jgi:hypothetical protein
MVILKNCLSNQIEAVNLMKLADCQQSLFRRLARNTHDIQLNWIRIIAKTPLYENQYLSRGL